MRRFAMSDWAKTIVVIITVIVSFVSTLWSMSKDYATLEARVTAVEKRHEEILKAFTAWKTEHANDDDKGWVRNASDHREIMAEVRSNAALLQEVSRRQAVVLDRLKIAYPPQP